MGVPGYSVVKSPPAKQERGVQSPGGEYPLVESSNPLEMYSFLEILWTEEPGGLQFMVLKSRTVSMHTQAWERLHSQ